MEINFTLVFAIVGIYFFAVLGSLLWSRLKETGSIMPGVEEFFLAKRSLPTPVLVFTYIGSLFSAFTVVGVPGAIYTHGISTYVYLTISVLIGIFVISKLAVKIRQYAQEHDVVSPIGLLRRSYNSTALGVIATLLLVLFLSPYLSLQLVGLGKLLEVVSHGEIDYVTGVGGVLLIVLVYVLFGGMRAVAYTDVVQTIVIFIGMFLGMFLLVSHYWGGLPELFAAVKEVSPQHLEMNGATGYYTPEMTASLLMYMTGIFFLPHLITRFMMAKDDKQVKTIIRITYLMPAISYLPGLLFGLMAVVLHPDLASSNLVGGMIFNDLTALGVLGGIAAMMLLIGVLGASMSTADSILLSISQLVTRDVVRPFVEISRKKQVLLARGVMVLLLGFAFVIGMEPPQLMIDLAFYAAKGAGLFIPLYFGVWWSRRNSAGAILGVSVGAVILLYLGLNNITPMGFDGSVWAWLASGGIFFISGYVLPKRHRVSE